ncbi:hypothetical protein LIA77_07650 [Sarocladium implicatum]|nr:hypothetical protein LIA77_07650 [Sarocladium implicatum]
MHRKAILCSLPTYNKLYPLSSHPLPVVNSPPPSLPNLIRRALGEIGFPSMGYDYRDSSPGAVSRCATPFSHSARANAGFGSCPRPQHLGRRPPDGLRHPCQPCVELNEG